MRRPHSKHSNRRLTSRRSGGGASGGITTHGAAAAVGIKNGAGITPGGGGAPGSEQLKGVIAGKHGATRSSPIGLGYWHGSARTAESHATGAEALWGAWGAIVAVRRREPWGF